MLPSLSVGLTGASGAGGEALLAAGLAWLMLRGQEGAAQSL